MKKSGTQSNAVASNGNWLTQTTTDATECTSGRFCGGNWIDSNQKQWIARPAAKLGGPAAIGDFAWSIRQWDNTDATAEREGASVDRLFQLSPLRKHAHGVDPVDHPRPRASRCTSIMLGGGL